MAFADINRDSVVDIAVACFHDYPDHSDSALTIDMYGGAAGFLQTRYYYPNAERTSGMWLIYSSGFTAFKALDVDHDGYDELFISYCNWIWDGGAGPPAHIWFEDQHAFSRLYYTFPDSIMWKSSDLMCSLSLIGDDDDAFLMANKTEWSRYRMGPVYENSQVQVARFGDDFSTTYDFSHDTTISNPGGECESIKSQQSLAMQCAGNIIASDGIPEFLAHFYYLWQCYDYMGALVSGVEARETRMYRMPSPDSAELIWVHDGNSNINYIYMPDYPGYYFAFHNGQLVQFDGATGGEVSSSQQTPGGSGHWDYPYRDGQPYWVTYHSDTVTIYAVGIVTDADEETPLPLPTTLILGKPYPNPFNAAQTIPVTVKAGGSLTVDVYDILGRKIARLYDGKAEKGKFGLIWNAGAHASGIYFVRAVSENESAVVRSILIK